MKDKNSLVIKIYVATIGLVLAGLAIYAGFSLFSDRSSDKDDFGLNISEAAVQEFKIDYPKLEELTKNHPNGEMLLKRISDNEKKLNDGASENDQEAYELIGFDMYQLGDNEGTILAYRASLSVLLNNIVALNNLANAYKEVDDYKNAERAYLKAISVSPGEVTTYRSLSDLYLYNMPEKENDIQKIMDEGLKSLPENPDILSYLAVYYQNKGEKTKAIEYYERLVKVNPSNTAAKEELNKLKSGL